MTNTFPSLPGGSSASALPSLGFIGHSTRQHIRTATTALIIFGMLLFSAAIARASAITFPPLQSPAAGSTTDGCTGCLFSYAAVPSGAVGDALTSWSFYALNTNSVTPVIFNSAGVVTGIGTTITPSGVGLQNDLFGLTAGNSILSTGDSLGWFYPAQGSIAVDLSTGPGITTEPFGGVTVGTAINTSDFYGNRNYAVSFTADQVALTDPSAPVAGEISDGCTNCLFRYTPVTSQYDGQTLQSWSLYALTTDPVNPVIFGPDGTVIGYGELDTPSSSGGLQTFAYVPLWGTAVLHTGDSLGWYYPDQGSIAFNVTGGQGAIYAPFPVQSLGPGDAVTTPVIDRDYSVGFSTSGPIAPTPEPSYAILLGIVLLALIVFRQKLGLISDSSL